MIKNIENKTLNIIVKDEKIQLPKEIKEKIQNHWESIKSKGTNIWNGEVICVADIKESKETVEIICKKSDYAHYIYGERIGLKKEYECKNLSGGVLLETKDNYYFIGELDESTSYPHMLQTSGGNIDKVDIKEGKVDIRKTIFREVKEELNIDIMDKKITNECKLKYMYISEEEEQPGVQIFAKVKLNMTKEELEEYFSNYLAYLRTNNLEIEFGKIHFLKVHTSIKELEKFKNPKRNYYKPLIEEDSKEQDIDR